MSQGEAADYLRFKISGIQVIIYRPQLNSVGSPDSNTTVAKAYQNAFGSDSESLWCPAAHPLDPHLRTILTASWNA
jgi:hypothetical protein